MFASNNPAAVSLSRYFDAPTHRARGGIIQSEFADAREERGNVYLNRVLFPYFSMTHTARYTCPPRVSGREPRTRRIAISEVRFAKAKMIPPLCLEIVIAHGP